MVFIYINKKNIYYLRTHKCVLQALFQPKKERKKENEKERKKKNKLQGLNMLNVKMKHLRVKLFF